MASGYWFKCDNCGYSFETSGLHEFYRDRQGNRKPYGHPCAISMEAQMSGIHGLSADLYCPTCDKVHDLVVVEYKRPTGDTNAMRAGRCEPSEDSPKEVKCPDCGNTELVLGYREAPQLPCPRCGKGTLTGGDAYQS